MSSAGLLFGSYGTAPLLPFQQALHEANDAGNEIARHIGYLHFAETNVEDPFHPLTSTDVSEVVHSARRRLADAAAKLLQLATDPKEYLEQLSANNQHLVSVRWLLNLNVLEHIPCHGPITYTKLAKEAGVPEGQLKSAARMAAAHGFLYDSGTSSQVCHSRTSRLVATDPNFSNWAQFLMNYSVPSAYKFPEATKSWGCTEKKNETAFNIAMDVKVPFFEHLKANEKMNHMFSSYMRNVASSEATSFKHLIAGFDWGSLAPGAVVVDVGGSNGHASISLANAFPHLSFVVQDLPETIQKAEVAFSGSAASDKRLKFMAHDFFTPQPVTGADIYLLRMIIHDWPDETALEILTHMKNALKKPSARILVMDTILPEPGAVPILQERQLRVRDLTMIQVFNAKEREYDDWKALLGRVGLELIGTRQPAGSNMGILEIGLPNGITTEDGDAERVDLTTNGIKPFNTSPVDPLNTASVKVNGHKDAANGHHDLKAADFTPDPQINNSVHKKSNGTAVEDSDLPVLIIGAGISGLCLAQHLQKNSIPFQVLERDTAEQSRPQGYRLKLESDAADALRESLNSSVYEAFEMSCAVSATGETDFDPISGACIKSRAGGGLAGRQGLRASYTVDRTVFRKILMTNIKDNVHFGKELVRYTIGDDSESSHVIAEFKDGSTTRGRFIVGADGSHSILRRQHLPDHGFLDTGAVCIYGKTTITSELLQRYPARALRWMTVCADTAPLIQSILIGESSLTLLSEPIRFSSESRAKSLAPLPEDYVYWVLIGRKELFTDITKGTASETDTGTKEKAHDTSAEASAAQSLDLTGEWHPALRSIFELQDVRQASTLRVISAPPKLPEWEPSSFVTLIGDAVHAMSPCGGVGANTALRDAAELGKLFAESRLEKDLAGKVGIFEQGMRKRAFAGLMRSFAGSKKMFDQRPFEELGIAKD